MDTTLISESYAELLQAKIKQVPQWGATGWRQAEWVREEMELVDPCFTLLDYGCGNGSLRINLAQTGALWQKVMYEYDPGRGIQMAPVFTKVDLTTCIDVMEHVEEDKVAGVLADILSHTRQVALFLVSTTPAVHSLPDGRNAHITIKPTAWWLEQMGEHFSKVEVVAEKSTWFKARCTV